MKASYRDPLPASDEHQTSWSFWSESLQAKLNLANCHDLLNADNVEEVAEEVRRLLFNAKRGLDKATANRFHIAPAKLLAIKLRKKNLADLHQAILVEKGRFSQEAKAERIRRNEERESEFPFCKFFQNVVRQNASPVDYQRWIVQAKEQQKLAVERSRRAVAGSASGEDR